MSNAVEGHEKTGAAQPEAKGTKYIILYRDGEGGWREAEDVVAPSADAAIRMVVSLKAAAFSNGAELVALPARSWNPRKVNVEQKTAVTLS